jgi:hypothetical protein
MGGERFAPSQVWFTGICPPSGKAGDVTSRDGITSLWPGIRHPEQMKMMMRTRFRRARAAPLRIRVPRLRISMCAPMELLPDKNIGEKRRDQIFSWARASYTIFR